MKLTVFKSPSAVIASSVIINSALLVGVGPAHAISTEYIAPIYNAAFSNNKWGDETQYGPAGANPASVGYWFKTDKDYVQVNALGFAAFQGQWPTANDYKVYLWKYTTSGGYTELASTTFSYAPLVNGLNPNYTFKDGYYWKEVPVVSLGVKSSNDPDTWFLTMAEGNYSTGALPYLAGGTGTFSDVAIFDGNSYSQTGDSEFPKSQDTLTDPSTGVPLYGLFNPNVSYIVPGPLPLFGAGVAFGFSRRMRARIRLSADRKSISVASK